MMCVSNKYYIKPCRKPVFANKPFKYRLIYCGSCIYQLTMGKYKVIHKTYSFKDMLLFITDNHINLHEVHLPYMSLFDFLKDWVYFEDVDLRGVV